MFTFTPYIKSLTQKSISLSGKYCQWSSFKYGATWLLAAEKYGRSGATAMDNKLRLVWWKRYYFLYIYVENQTIFGCILIKIAEE